MINTITKNDPDNIELLTEANKIRPQAHSDYIYNQIDSYGNRIDIVVEAKAKELAVLRYRNIYQYKGVKL